MPTIKTYTIDDVIRDLADFFTNPDHEIYRYGSASRCGPDCPYHRKQIEVLFEDKYDHWDTNKAVDKLVVSGFLKMVKVKGMNFVFRADLETYKEEANRRFDIVQKYSHPTITSANGQWAEKITEFTFKAHGFEVVGFHTNKYLDRKWTTTNENLDLIIAKDNIAYGIEVKNTLSYMEVNEFTNKVEMCRYLGLRPLWILRAAPEIQFNTMKARNGLILRFKTQMFPYGQEDLVKEIWSFMRLPVGVKAELPPKIVNFFLQTHNALI